MPVGSTKSVRTLRGFGGPSEGEYGMYRRGTPSMGKRRQGGPGTRPRDGTQGLQKSMLDVEVGGGPDFQKAQLFNDKREGAAH